MANEITHSYSLALSNGGLEITRTVAAYNANQAAARIHSDTQNIGTTKEAIGLGSVANPRWGRFKNLDATNFIEIGALDGSSNFIAVVRLDPGVDVAFPLGTATPYAQADTGACELDYTIYDA